MRRLALVRKTVTICGAVLALWMGGVGPAAAMTADDVVFTWRQQQQVHTHVLDEIARQAAQRQSDIEQEIALLRGYADDLAANAALQGLDQDRRKDNADLAVSTFNTLRAKDAEQAHIPRIGWGIFGYFEKRRDDTNAAIAEAEGAVARGETQFHLAGVGWMSGDELQARIKSREDEIAGLRASVDAGTFSIHYPGIGWVTRQDIETRNARLDKQIAETLAVIEKGEYSVHIPQIGWITRTGLEERIAKAEQELADMRTVRDQGELSIHRSGWGWHTHDQLDERVDALTKEKADLETQASAGTFSHAVVGGWVTGQSLDERIASLDEEADGVGKQFSAGEYTIPGSEGWKTRPQVQDLLALPDCIPGCKQNCPNPCLDRGRRPGLQDYLGRYDPAFNTHLKLIALDRELAVALKAKLGEHIRPRVKAIDHELDRIGREVSEFDREVANNEVRLKAHIEWLRRALDTMMP